MGKGKVVKRAGSYALVACSLAFLLIIATPTLAIPTQPQVACGGSVTVGLKSDGTVVALGSNKDGQCDLASWRHIVQVATSGFHTVGVKSDGTVLALGNNKYGQCDVSNWKEIVQVAAGGFHAVGLKSDGTVVAMGANGAGQCDVSNWNLGTSKQ